MAQKTVEHLLIQAIVKEDIEAFTSLARKKINWQFKDGWNNNKSFLHYCQNLDMAQVLVKKGVDPHQLDRDDMNVLFYTQNIRLIEYYLSLNVNYQVNSKYEQNVLFHVIGKEGYDKAKLFLDLGVNSLQKNIRQATVIHHASDPKTLKLFLDAGVDINALDDYQNSALHYSTRYQTIKFLLEHGIEANGLNCHNLNALFNHQDLSLNTIKLLVKYGSDPLLISDYQQNLLHNYYKNEKIVHYLLDLGLEADLKNKIGVTPKDLAFRVGSTVFDTYEIKKEKKQLENTLSHVNEYENFDNSTLMPKKKMKI